MTIFGQCHNVLNNKMEYLKPGEYIRMMYYSVSDKGILECSYQESNLRPSDY